jgi:isomerase DpgB
MVTGIAGNELVLRVDGGRPPSRDSIAELGAICDAAENDAAHAFVIVAASGVPGPDWASSLSVALVNLWERGLRRLERLPAVTIGIAGEDCGGPALDVLLATDYRIMPAQANLIVPVVAGATWPGMVLYRLARQAAGAAAVRRAVLFGTPIGAAEARAIGVIDDVTEQAPIAIGRAVELAAAAHGAELTIRRQLMHEAMTTSYEEALGVHLAACDRALRRLAVGAAG